MRLTREVLPPRLRVPDPSWEARQRAESARLIWVSVIVVAFVYGVLRLLTEAWQ